MPTMRDVSSAVAAERLGTASVRASADRYRQDGFVTIGRTLTSSEVQRLRVVADDLLGDGPDSLPPDHRIVSQIDGHVRAGLHVCHRHQAFREHALSPTIVESVAAAMGEPVSVLTSIIFRKPSLVGEVILAHQDASYYPYLDGDQIVTAWTALTDTTASNGAVGYWRGSHRQELVHENAQPVQDLSVPLEELGQFELAQVPLHAGGTVLHHGRAVHESGSNYTDTERLGVAVVYVSARAVVRPVDFPYGTIQVEAVGDPS